MVVPLLFPLTVNESSSPSHCYSFIYSFIELLCVVKQIKFAILTIFSVQFISVKYIYIVWKNVQNILILQNWKSISIKQVPIVPFLTPGNYYFTFCLYECYYFR